MRRRKAKPRTTIKAVRLSPAEWRKVRGLRASKDESDSALLRRLLMERTNAE